LLEADRLLFRGAFRLTIPLAAITAVQAARGRLKVMFPEGVATFELGARAERWASRLRTPKPLLDKLGVRPDSRVVILGVEDPTFFAELEAFGVIAAKGRPRYDVDLIVLGAKTVGDLRRLRSLQEDLTPTGAIWVVAPRGGQPSERAILSAGRAARLVDTKVVRFSETHTAHKFVVPLARRPRDARSRKS